ncbi:MAG: hypothetical protein CBC38_02510 [Gammaproteobacteria bacterium TMED78]|nr:MAG: hypothetical protein CBC38_02510 [Gammaproteobacteria bacterium TMED78]|tara:strand:- start:126326 stop:127711 length:1386 start_codon:yes stop_codon:yes gene_type:complete
MQSQFDIITDLDTPVSAYLKLKELKPCFLLESVEGGESLARYSFLGLNANLIIELSENYLLIDGKKTPRPNSKTEWVAMMRKSINKSPELFPKIDGLPFCGGLVGTTGYDVINFFENLPDNQSELKNLPQALYVSPSSLLVFDHSTRKSALLHSGSNEERESLRKKIISLLNLKKDLKPKLGKYSNLEASINKNKFIEIVKKCKAYIKKGDIYQIVMSIRFSGKSDADPFQCYRAMRTINPSPYLYFFDVGKIKISGSSPEALVKLEDGQAILNPIAGTKPRGSSKEQDILMEKELLNDPKENAEHVMLVDLARNDLGRVASAGSINVDPYRKIERYSHVMHIVSGVKGRLIKNKDALDLFSATFPAGTLVGAPKIRAMEIIRNLEPCGRGLYGGTIGYFSKNGNMDQAITIRTMVFNEDEVSFQAGAGIVADSIPETEYQEVLAKSEVLRKSLKMASEGL